jgi:hypothetical protein
MFKLYIQRTKISVITAMSFVVVSFILFYFANERGLVSKVFALNDTYFVSISTGSNTNDGSEAHPWASIQKAAEVAQEGDTINILAGIYNESVFPVNSGTQSNPITYRKYGGGTVNIISQDWAAISINNVNGIIIDGLNIDANYSNGGFIGVAIHNGSYNIIRNNDISNAEIAVHIYGGNGDTIEYGVSSIGNTVLDNSIHDTFGIYREGVYIKNYMPYDIQTSYVQNTIVENNTIYNVGEAVQNTGATWTEAGPLLYLNSSVTPSNTIIRGNTVYNNDCEAGLFSGAGDNYLVEDNFAYNNGNGPDAGSYCSIGNGNGKNYTIRNNVLVNNGGTSEYRAAITIRDGVGEISNNTIVDYSNRAINIYLEGTPIGHAVVKNNIIYGMTGEQILRFGTNNDQIDIKYNLFGKVQGYLGTNYLIQDPLFKNPLSNDYHLNPLSAACAAGEGLTYMGAYECVLDVTDTPTPTSTIVPTETSSPTPTIEVSPSITLTNTPIPLATFTAFPTSTSTIAPTNTRIPVTSTRTPTRVPTKTPVPSTQFPTVTSTATPTMTITSTPFEITIAPSSTIKNTPIPTITPSGQINGDSISIDNNVWILIIIIGILGVGVLIWFFASKKENDSE